MNIIKFKDTIRLGDEPFNRYLKGKYAYFIRMRYAVPFDFITVGDYVKCEDDINTLISSDTKYWDMHTGDLAAYVDEGMTDEANSIRAYVRENKYVTDQDITFDEIKKFRTWLASSLLEFDQNSKCEQRNRLYTDLFTRVLKYYANGMYDDVVKVLSEISSTARLVKGTESNCGCCSPGSGSTLMDLGTISYCNALAEYRTHIYNNMLSRFGTADFWTQFPIQFLSEFKQYIDNILRAELPLVVSVTSENYTDCSCLTGTANLANREILDRLSRAIQYLIEDEGQSHKNYINNAFMDWASNLYEHMEW